MHADLELKKDAEIFEIAKAQVMARVEQVEVVKLLLSMDGIDPNKALADDGRTPLVMASEKNHVEVVKLLLSMDGIEPNKALTGDGATPLWQASCLGHVEVV